jgi:hypothetical protein
MIVDLDDLGLNHAKNISPFYAKKISGLLQVNDRRQCCCLQVVLFSSYLFIYMYFYLDSRGSFKFAFFIN